MSLAAFASAVLALLLAPGPTNTLIALAGAAGGLKGSARMLPAELAGYLTTILPLALIGAPLFAAFPDAAVALKLAAALWIFVLAVRLWRAGALEGAGMPVSAHRVYVTTVLNPKAIVFALVLLPHAGSPDFLPRLGLFCALVCAVALLWGASGAMARLGDAGERRLFLLQRLAASWLVVVAVTLLGGMLAT